MLMVASSTPLPAVTAPWPLNKIAFLLPIFFATRSPCSSVQMSSLLGYTGMPAWIRASPSLQTGTIFFPTMLRMMANRGWTCVIPPTSFRTR